MAGWHIGVIGGSGLYQGTALDEAQEIPVASACLGKHSPSPVPSFSRVVSGRHGSDEVSSNSSPLIQLGNDEPSRPTIRC